VRASKRIGIENMVSMYQGCLAIVLARSGKLGEAEECIRQALESKGIPRTVGVNSIYFAQILLMRKRCHEALEESERATRLLAEFPSYRAMACGVSVQALLECGRTQDALSGARVGMRIMDDLGGLEEGGSLVRLAYAEALHAVGDTDGARVAIAEAREHLLAQASKLRDPARRKSFLEGVMEHRRILDLARQWS
jgi:eukaryotic-like serine/threonine-protein kinase